MAPQSLDTLHLNYSPLREWDLDRQKIPQAKEPGGAAQTALLEVRDIHFSYSEKKTVTPEEALKGVSFSVGRGECVGLVGRNGSGKSTMAKCICGFVLPRTGTVTFSGEDLADFSIMERAEKIGYVMQNPNQMISFPLIYDEAALGLRTRAVPEAEVKERVYQALRICGLYPFRNWPVSALSYGQKKRLTIASILVLNPLFMILDEPTAGQDYRHYSEFMEFLMGLNRDRGISLLLITHDMHLMLEYTTRAVVLSEGIRIADAEPFEVLTNEEVIGAASLKRTSLYDVALKAGCDDPRGFVERYIRYERKRRASTGIPK
jgi:energy-coupling factor transport system ATP-binding protein